MHVVWNCCPLPRGIAFALTHSVPSLVSLQILNHLLSTSKHFRTPGTKASSLTPGKSVRAPGCRCACRPHASPIHTFPPVGPSQPFLKTQQPCFRHVPFSRFISNICPNLLSVIPTPCPAHHRIPIPHPIPMTLPLIPFLVRLSTGRCPRSCTAPTFATVLAAFAAAPTPTATRTTETGWWPAWPSGAERPSSAPPSCARRSEPGGGTGGGAQPGVAGAAAGALAS